MTTPAPNTTHLVLIPSYNPGPAVYDTVRGAREHWNPVWVVVDGSSDGTREGLEAMAAADPGLRVLVLPANRGKGSAVLHGMQTAQAAGFSPYSAKWASMVSRRPGESAATSTRGAAPERNCFSAASGSCARRSTATGGGRVATTGSSGRSGS